MYIYKCFVFFGSETFGYKDGLSLQNLGNFMWKNVLSFFAAWVIVYFALCNGVKLSGKVSRPCLASILNYDKLFTDLLIINLKQSLCIENIDPETKLI